MAHNGRVIPDCSYASNPYHECTETCLIKIREAPPTRTKKSSGVIPLKFGWKKKPNSKPEPPVIDRAPATKVRVSYHPEKKRVETKTNEQLSSEAFSTEKHFQDVMPIYQKDGAKDDVKHFNNNHKDQANEDVDAKHFISYDKDQVQDDVKHFANNHKDQAKDHVDHFSNNHTKANKDEIKALDKVVPFAYADDTGDCLSPSAGRLLDFRLSGINITNGDEDSEEETESLASEPRVPVGSYRVRESYAPILRAIFNKYGDIGANVQLESAVMRTYYVECVCFVVQELQSTSIMEFTKSKVKELKAILKDVESAKLQVSWLQSILNEVAEYIELISQHQAVEMAKANSDSEVELLKEELESDLKTLAQREQEVAAIKNRISETRDRLRELELRSCELDKNMSMIKSKVDGLNGKSLIEELL